MDKNSPEERLLKAIFGSQLEADLRVRGSTDLDTDRINQFYFENPSEFIVPRSTLERGGAISSGQYLLIEEPRSGRLIACAAVFYYNDDVRDVIEISDTLVVEDYRGLKIQPLLTRLRIAFGLAALQIKSFTTAINPRNAVSLQNQIKFGFIPWKAEPYVYVGCGSCASRSPHRLCCCDYFELPPKTTSISTLHILEESKTGYTTLSNDKKSVTLSFELFYLTDEETRADLKNVAESL